MEDKQSDIKKILAEKERLDEILQSQFSKKISVMFTDIKGSTSFYESRGDIDGRYMVHKHHEIVLPLIRQNNCLFIKTIGDGTLSAFDDPLMAVKAATAIQTALQAYNADKPENQQIYVRIGLNYGTGIVEEADVHGDVVNVASRVEGVADAGEIMLTEDMYRELKNDDELIFRYVDSVQVKGKKDPLKIFRLVWHEEELSMGKKLRSPEMHRMKEGIFVIEAVRTGQKLKISGVERLGREERPVKSYEDVRFHDARVKEYTRNIIDLLNRANRRGKIGNDLLIKMKEYGRLLFDELIPVQLKNKILNTKERNLLISIDDELVHIPWELLHDGKDFLCQRFSVGRTVSTRQPVSVVVRAVGRPLKMQIIADGRGDLPAAYQEGVVIKDEIGKLDDWIAVSLKTTDARMDYVKAKIRNFDIVHYAGHAEHNSHAPQESGWLLKDGKISSRDIINMTGAIPMPSLIFSNACQSGHTEEWKLSEDYGDRIFGLANAFLLSGVQHYIGTFWEIPDEASAFFAIHFYRNLVVGKSIGEALRLSRHSLIEKYGEDTIVWASYMLYGDPTTIYIDPEMQSSTEEAVKQPAAEEMAGQELRSREEVIQFPPAQRTKRNMMAAGIGLVFIALIAWLVVTGDMIRGNAPKSVSVEKPARDEDSGTAKKRIDELVAGLAKNYREGRFEQTGKADDDWSSSPITLVFMDVKTIGPATGSGDINEKKLTARLSQFLQSNTRVSIVEREILERLLDELKLSSSSLADPATSLKIGKLLSAKFIVTGSIIQEKKGLSVMLRFIDTETTAVKQVVSAESASNEIDGEVTGSLGSRILAWVSTDYPLKGRVSSISGDTCLINLGQMHGVRKGDRLEAVRESPKGPVPYRVIGELEVSAVSRDSSHAIVLSKTENIKEKTKIRQKERQGL